MDKKKIFYFALGPVLSGILGSFSLPVVAWLFSKEDIGRIAMLQIVCSFTTLLFSLGLDQAYVREYHEEDSKPALLFLTILPGLILMILFWLISLNFTNQIVTYIYEKNVDHLFFFTFASIFAVFISRFFLLVIRMQENAFAYSMCQIAPKTIFCIVIFVFWLLALPKDLIHLIFANSIGFVATLITLTWLIRAELIEIFRVDIEWRSLKKKLNYGIPLILGGVAFWGLSAMSRIYLRGISNYSELGLYSVALSIASAASLCQGVFTTIWAPTVYKWAANGESLEKIDVVAEYVLAFVVITFILFGLTAWLIPKFLPPDYLAVQYLIVACLGQPLLYALSEVTVVGINLVRKTFYAMLAPLLAVLANYFFCQWLIPIYGARGAAFSTFLSFIVFFVVRTEGSAYVWRSFRRRKMYFFLGVISFNTWFSVFMASKLFFLNLIIWFSTLIFAIFSFRKVLLFFVDKIFASFGGKRFGRGNYKA